MTKRSSILSNVSSATRSVGVLGLLLALGCGEAETNASTSAAASASEPSNDVASAERAPASPSVAQGAGTTQGAVPTAVVAPSAVPSSTLTAPSRPRGTETAGVAPELRSAEGVTLRRLALTRRVEGREPVSPSTRFSASSERLYAFVEAASTADEARELVVSFFGPDRRHTGVVTLTIPADAPRWRTWAYTAHANEPGAWTAEVRTKEGALVGRQRFVIE